MTDTFPLPYHNVGGPLATLADVQDPTKLLQLLQRFAQQLDGVQGNFDHFSTVFPLSSPKLLQSIHMSDTADSTLTLTTSDQDIPGISITLPLSGTYLQATAWNASLPTFNANSSMRQPLLGPSRRRSKGRP